MPREIEFKALGGRIFIDGEPFDWGLDDQAVEEANGRCSSPQFTRAIHADIMAHFLDSLSQVLGFSPSMREVNEALERGFISR